MAPEPNDGIEDAKAHHQRRRIDEPLASDYRDDSEGEDDRSRRRRRRERDEEDDEPRSIGDDAGMRMLLPVGRSIWAIIAGYLGLLSVLCIPAPFALILGIVAIFDIKYNPKKHGMGRAIFAIVMGAIFSAVFLFFVLRDFMSGAFRLR